MFNLAHDPSERFDLAEAHPEVIQAIEGIVKEHQKNAIPAKSHLEKRLS